jgi:hypothetical protein
MTAIHAIMREQEYSEEDIQIFDEDLGIEGDNETAYMHVFFLNNADSEFHANEDLLHIDAPPVTGLDFSELEAGVSAIVDDFGIDALVNIAGGDRIAFPECQIEGPVAVTLNRGIIPPRPPTIDACEVSCIGILFSSSYSRRSFDLRRTSRWNDIVSEVLKGENILGDESHFDDMRRRHSLAYGDSPLTLSSLSSVTDQYDKSDRSNMRPRGGPIYLCMSKGQMINIGTHGLMLKDDLMVPLDFSDSVLALSELFGAPAGEGMSCPTASHELHQAVEAVLSMAIEKANGPNSVLVEHEGMDLFVTIQNHAFEIDVTSTYGLWKKNIAQRRMAAISKYDLGAAMVRIGLPAVKRVFSLLIANCLAIEHPAYYGKPNYSDLSNDLQIQYRISDRLHTLSQGSVSKLSEMSYHAVVKASYDFAKGKDYRTPGKPFKDKVSELVSYLDGLRPRKSIAIPPYPLSAIVPFKTTNIKFKVCGHEITVNVPGMIAQVADSSFKTEDTKVFLERFPASGIVSYDEAKEITDLLLENKCICPEGGFKGPLPKIQEETPGGDIWELCGQIYSTNAIAQFAELRADLTRAIFNKPMPPPNTWRSFMAMKGHVVVWYRSRDAANSPLGYRIDWFAISAFPSIGSVNVSEDANNPVWLWPRQRLRSQEMDLAAMAPRRLKLTLLSMLEKSRVVKTSIDDIVLAWQKLALTATSSTWASGENYISCRHISSSLTSPSPPFHEMKSKIKAPKTFACMVYLRTLEKTLRNWRTREQYGNTCALLGLPRIFSQLEAYWQVWVPSNLADPVTHLADCVLSLHEEYQLLMDTMDERVADLTDQYALITQNEVTFQEIYDSVNRTMSLDTGGKLGWSIWGSLGASYALNLQADVSSFDKSYSRGKLSRRITDHLTVRHSMRLAKGNVLQSGTVAELIVKSGLDSFLSQAEPTFRFFYRNRPKYFNHAKNGEDKNREISMADPDTRIMLNNAELINGSYGKHTKIDMLKRSDKDAYFYRIAEQAMIDGGAIQASDATRFSAMMSNIATGITNLGLGCMGGSAHLLSSAATYRRLASRQMVIDTEIIPVLYKRVNTYESPSERSRNAACISWINQMDIIGRKDTHMLRGYCTAVHTGQGMSHHGTSLAHAGALLMSLAACEMAEIYVSGKRAHVAGIPMVTSDDSTIVAGIDESKTIARLSRQERQRACKQFLRIQQQTRLIALRSVSVKQNLPKEKISGVAGEFNSQDTGIGRACPILGFREMICQLVLPCSPNLIGDYLNAEAYSRNIALSGQGLITGLWAARIYIDSIEQRWKLLKNEKIFLESLTILPDKLTKGPSLDNLLTCPAACLPANIRGKLMTLANIQNSKMENIDPHTTDTCFSPLLHVSLSMSNQHRNAINCLKTFATDLESQGMIAQSQLILNSLHDTLASARHRNIGRIGQRIRNKEVRPADYDGEVFQKAPILETTLSWLQHLEYRIRKIVIDPSLMDLISSYGTKIIVSNIHHSRFPKPPTRKRAIGIVTQAPIYVLKPYGRTPFGRHAIERSGGILISEYGMEERKAYARYNAAKAYRKIGEHVRYGSKFQTNWLDMRAGTLKAVVERADIKLREDVSVQWGILDEDSISMLKDLELRNSDMPVLASTIYDGNKMHYHCVWGRHPYTHVEIISPQSLVEMSSHTVMLQGGVSAIVAITKLSYDRPWSGSGPTKEEIKAFQYYPRPDLPNRQAEGLLRELDGQETLNVPTLAYIGVRENEKTLFSCSRPYKKRSSRALAPHERSKVIGTLAMGGYWYSALKGVCFRAYLKGHVGTMTSWTGTVLGWRCNVYSDPEYEWEPPTHGNVEYIAMIGGLDSDDDILAVNTDKFSTGKFYVDRDGLHSVDRVCSLELTNEICDLIYNLNSGNALFNKTDLEYQLVDALVPTTGFTTLDMSKDELESRLYDLADGEDLWDSKW